MLQIKVLIIKVLLFTTLEVSKKLNGNFQCQNNYLYIFIILSLKNKQYITHLVQHGINSKVEQKYFNSTEECKNFVQELEKSSKLSYPIRNARAGYILFKCEINKRNIKNNP